jgi:hypothetical protein
VQLEGVVGVGARQLGPPHRPDGEEEPADRASGPPGRDQPARGRIGDRRDAERERTPDPAPDRLADVLAWVDYRDRLLDSEAPVLVWRIPIAALPPNANRVFLRALCAGVMPVAINPSG